ncbi:TolC family protein [Poseidonibacter lekithochrous]|uniref:TolC family protein n=1 Tax=Poseidonibacter lekithochrous TaxID=1904463 RepID=UPI000D3AD159|nr:TolC family protein [Poseidonibacter lekithochrous]
MYIKKLFKFTCLSFLASSSLYGLSLKESVQRVLEKNPEVIAEKKNKDAFKYYIDEREGNFYPRIDLDGRVEQSTSDKQYDKTSANSDGSDQEDGYNFGIALNQILYDGDLTPSQVREAEYNNLANKYRTDKNIDDVIFQTINAYTGLVQYRELLGLTQVMIAKNEENLSIAKEKEAISGEILETYQVESKLSFVKEKYLEERDIKSSRNSTFKRYVGVESDGKECRPTINELLIPKTLQETVRQAVLNNYEVQEQIERIKAQREKIAQADAAFLPTLNLELKAITDNDLSLNEEGVENQAFGRITLAWNLYNGSGDYAVSKQEDVFLSEQKERLDSITKKVVEEVKVVYQRYKKNKERIEILKRYVYANENIVEVYKSEFQSGTRTFVDILDAQTVLYEAEKSLVNREFELYSNYYTLLNSLSTLTKTVLESDVKECLVAKTEKKEIKKEMLKKEEDVSDELSALLGDDLAMKSKKEEVEEAELELDESTEEVVEEELIADSSMESSTSEEPAFLTVSSENYTINIATTNGLSQAKNYVNERGLDEGSSFTYEFGPEMKSAKVLYGIFTSIKEAKIALSNLPEAIKAGGPYIDNVDKHQKLYAKYH